MSGALTPAKDKGAAPHKQRGGLGREEQREEGWREGEDHHPWSPHSAVASASRERLPAVKVTARAELRVQGSLVRGEVAAGTVDPGRGGQAPALSSSRSFKMARAPRVLEPGVLRLFHRDNLCCYLGKSEMWAGLCIPGCYSQNCTEYRKSGPKCITVRIWFNKTRESEIRK